MSAESSSIRADHLARSYNPPPQVFDEMRGADGSIRPAWTTFFEKVGLIDRKELRARWEKARELLHQNGISYDVYGDPHGLDRPWSLSPVPVLLSGDDWQILDDGLTQRARLLDALLRDLYGPQRSLIENLLPPELVFENPSFLRPCHGMAVANDCWLPLYSADLVRLPHGAFAVTADRTQAPSGLGYALENRIVISGVLPEAFRDCNVERLALFFRTLRDTLQGLSPHNRDNPRIVLLTSGPSNATYFEQAYLAQYLGYTLVSGADLTVRRDRVFLKTLGGLQPVDVILRRVNDDYCDALELRPESQLGAPGLVQATRAGNVAIASPLGSGLVQTPALLPYLNGLARVFLGEELRLTSLRTLWCGDPLALREGLASFDDAVVRPTFADGPSEPVFTARLGKSQRAALIEKIRANPRRYVIQERASASTTPVLTDDLLVPRPLGMRCFVVAGRAGYMAMPGALSRFGNSNQDEPLADDSAGGKDTWVLARGKVAKFSLLPPSHRSAPLSRGGSDLPSRATDNLYWLGRYAERAEAVARLVRAVGSRLTELGSQEEMERSAEFAPLLGALTAQTALMYTAPMIGRPLLDLAAAERQLIDAVRGEEGGGTLKAAVRSSLRAGRLVRDRISADTWRVLAALGDDLREGAPDPRLTTLRGLQDVLSRVILRLAAFSGLVMDSMTRGHAWRFLDMGRRLERAVTLVSLLRATMTLSCKREGPLLEAVLEIADSGMTYRRRYLASLQVAPVVDLLLTDETNPRSVIYQMEAILKHIEALPASLDGMRSPQELTALSVLTQLKLTDVERVCAPDAEGERPELDTLLLDLATRIPALSESLSDRYLSHATVLRHLTLDENPQSSAGEVGAAEGP
jgi:uncharacterized circularly permuted ATP-grasp superfamily protein/uncharacterized alpha-E superfamily protein